MPAMDVFAWTDSIVPASSKQQEVEFVWAGTLARDIGTVVHDQLQLLSDKNDEVRKQMIADMPRLVERQLQNLCVPQDMLKGASEKVMRALNSTLSDDRGQWILSDEHEDARSEWAITGPVNGLVKRIVIDRTFIDKDDTRWIIDYKTGDHEGSDRDAFLDQEQERYAEQLQRYADIIGRMEQRPVKAALYFPLLKGWRVYDSTQLNATGQKSYQKSVEANLANSENNDGLPAGHQAELF